MPARMNRSDSRPPRPGRNPPSANTPASRTRGAVASPGRGVSPARAGAPAASPAAPVSRGGVRVYRAPDASAPRRAVPGAAAATLAAPVAGSAGDGAVRLNKRMAELGLCSRREADDWIARGWVRVNGEVAGMGVKVLPGDAIAVDRAAQGQQARQVTILLNKPVGYVSGQAEDGHQPAVTLIQARSRWSGDRAPQQFQPAQLRGLAPAGRLDIDSVGLLVLTQDGRVARQLIGEDSDIDKEYLVRVEYGAVAHDVQQAFPAERLALLRHGLSLDGQALRPAQVDWQNPEQLRFVLREGKKRQIRRMCEQVGLKVVGLKRIRMGQVLLGQMPPGTWRYLGADERF
ncbi:MAG: pseudouridine synthase [Comamonas sp.]